MKSTILALVVMAASISSANAASVTAIHKTTGTKSLIAARGGFCCSLYAAGYRGYGRTGWVAGYRAAHWHRHGCCHRSYYGFYGRYRRHYCW